MASDGDLDGTVYLETRPHAAALAVELGRCGTAVGLCAGGIGWLAEADVPFWRLPAAALGGLAAAAALRALRTVWRWDRTLLTVTSDAVLLRRGGLRRSTTRLPLAAVEGVTIAQSPAGRMLGYGTVRLSGTTGTRGLRYVPRPAEVGRLILRLTLARTA